MDRLRSLRALAPVLVVALVVAGCGGGDGGTDQIPVAAARALVRDIDTVERRVRAGECRKTRPTMRRLTATARGLPEDVNADLRATLTGGVERLGRLVQSQCRQKRPKPKPAPAPVVEEPEVPVAPDPTPVEPEPEPTPEPEPEPAPVEEEPPPVEEEPQEEEPAEEEPPAEEPKPDKEPKDKVGDPCGPNAPPTC